MSIEVDSRTVALTVPARADYLVLARLALSAVCRLTSLRADDVADLKLAVTEAASPFVGGPEADDQNLAFYFQVADDHLLVELRGTQREDVSEEERDLGRAIIEATVDQCVYDDESVRLTKSLSPTDE